MPRLDQPISDLKTKRANVHNWWKSDIGCVRADPSFALLFAAALFEPNFGKAIASLFIGSMVAIGVGFGFFLVKTRLASRSMRIRPELLAHAPDEQ